MNTGLFLSRVVTEPEMLVLVMFLSMLGPGLVMLGMFLSMLGPGLVVLAMKVLRGSRGMK